MKFYPEGKNPQLSKQFETVDDIKDAMVRGEVLESKVLLCDREHNLHVDLGAVRGIIPRVEGAVGIDDGSVRDIALISKVNKSVCFTVLGYITTALPYCQGGRFSSGALTNFSAVLPRGI